MEQITIFEVILREKLESYKDIAEKCYKRATDSNIYYWNGWLGCINTLLKEIDNDQ